MNRHYQALQEQYSIWLNTLGFSTGLVKGFPSMVIDFFEWLEAQNINHISILTYQHVRLYYEYLQNRPNKRYKGGLSVSSLNGNFMAIDKLLECLHQLGMTHIPSPLNFRLPVDEVQRILKIEPFTQEEIRLLQATIPKSFQRFDLQEREAKHEQLKLIFVLFYGCGLRRAEGCRLTVDDINFDRRTIFIRQGKYYKDRIVPMNDSVYKALQHYIYNFRNQQKTTHKRLFINAYFTLWDNLKELQNTCENEAIRNKRLTFHILRHSIATHLLQNGMSVENIARFLGHSSLDSTQIYTHIINK